MSETTIATDPSTTDLGFQARDQEITAGGARVVDLSRPFRHAWDVPDDTGYAPISAARELADEAENSAIDTAKKVRGILANGELSAEGKRSRVQSALADHDRAQGDRELHAQLIETKAAEQVASLQAIARSPMASSPEELAQHREIRTWLLAQPDHVQSDVIVMAVRENDVQILSSLTAAPIARMVSWPSDRLREEAYSLVAAHIDPMLAVRATHAPRAAALMRESIDSSEAYLTSSLSDEVSRALGGADISTLRPHRRSNNVRS